MTQHGTRRGYAAGCRCSPCREANRVYMRAYRAHRKDRGLPPGPLQAIHPRHSDGYVPPAATTVLLAVMRAHRQHSRVTIEDLISAAGRTRSTLHTHLVKLRAHGVVGWEPERSGTLRPTCAVVCHDEHWYERSATLGGELSGPGAALTAPVPADPNLAGGADVAGQYPGTTAHAQGRR